MHHRIAASQFLRRRQEDADGFLKTSECLNWQNQLQLDTFPMVSHETVLEMGNNNKVFSSIFLNEDQILLGTKCNKMIVHDLPTKKSFSLPLMERPETSTLPPAERCGMHCMARNTNGSRVAVGGGNVNDIAIHTLPDLEPFTLGVGHKDWVFGMQWLTDNVLISGSRDGSMKLWNFSTSVLGSTTKPVSSCDVFDDNVRDIALCTRRMEVAALSPFGQLKIMDLEYWLPVTTVQSPSAFENLCVTMNEGESVYAVGAFDGFTLMDNSGESWRCHVPLPENVSAVRTMVFREHALTIGCGTGEVLVYDVRNRRYYDRGRLRPAKSRMPVRPARYLDMHNLATLLSQAVYTLSYSPSGTKLFAAGGPLNAALYGNFASLYK